MYYSNIYIKEFIYLFIYKWSIIKFSSNREYCYYYQKKEVINKSRNKTTY